MTRYPRLVWLITLYAAQFLTAAAWLHEEVTVRMIQVGRGSELLLQQDPLMGDDESGMLIISKKTHHRCRRCLQIRVLNSIIQLVVRRVLGMSVQLSSSFWNLDLPSFEMKLVSSH